MEVPLHHRTVFFRGGAQVTVYIPLTCISDVRGWQGDCAAFPLIWYESRATHTVHIHGTDTCCIVEPTCRLIHVIEPGCVS